nr:ketoacyl-ACP synthase III [Thermoleophilaceae bacterium]
EQMMGELREYPSPHDGSKTVLETIDLVVPHQANRTMVTELAVAAGLEPDQLYFNIEKVGNVSAASIPLAISDAMHEGVIDRPMRLFAPGFGAGAVGGYAVLRLDPAIVVAERSGSGRDVALDGGVRSGGSSSSDDAATAFGG